jgi:hypothetical protein
MKLLLTIVFLGFNLQFVAGHVRYELPCDVNLLSESYNCMIAQLGVLETAGHNDGPKIKEYLASVGLREGNPYCAAGQYYCFRLPCVTYGWSFSLIPIPRTGHANTMYNYAMKHGHRSKYIARVHDLIVWKYPNSGNGHIERIISVLKSGWVETVGFNTSGRIGNQRDGNGVFKKYRNILHPIARMQVRGLIGFN